MLTSLSRPEVPDLITTSNLRHLKCVAIKVTSSSFALPSTGGAFNSANHVPSALCVKQDLREFGLTLTRSITAAFLRRSNDRV